MMSLTTWLSFWGLMLLESVAAFSIYGSTKKVDKTSYELWHEKFLSVLLKSMGCEATMMGLVLGLVGWGSPENVLKLFREMVGEGGRGNDTTVVSVVTACGRSCRLKEGRSVHGYVVRMLMGVTSYIHFKKQILNFKYEVDILKAVDAKIRWAGQVSPLRRVLDAQQACRKDNTR
ncbi:hypothetical protein Tco_0268559 [Tanacetum coccineum]